MTETITAIYENGVLRPTRPLNLRDRQRVRIQIVPDGQPGQNDAAESAIELEQIIENLVAAGLVRPRPSIIPPDPVSEQERRALAETLGRAPGKPLSEIIIEERGEW